MSFQLETTCCLYDIGLKFNPFRLKRWLRTVFLETGETSSILQCILVTVSHFQVANVTRIA